MSNILVTLILLIMVLSIVIFLYYDKLSIERKIENTQVFNLPEDNYQVIVYGKQYRVIYNNLRYANIYNFPQGTKLSSDKERYFIIDSIDRFIESENINNRRKVFEAEMFMDLSDSFSKWDKEFSVKE